jgi:hypothetical protein
LCANLSAINREPNSDRSLDQSKEERTIKLGMDVHAVQITICRQEGGLLPQPAQKMPWDKALAWIAGLVASGARVYSCYEAGPCGYGLHRQLLAMGVSNFVVTPQRLDQHCKRVKTDKSDARQLADRLDRYVRGNTAAFSVVRVPTEEQEQLPVPSSVKKRVLNSTSTGPTKFSPGTSGAVFDCPRNGSASFRWNPHGYKV